MGANLLTKAWECPACSKEFIVASDATQDICPWCNTVVEDHSGKLEKAAEKAAAPRDAEEQTQKTAQSGEAASVDGYPYCLEASGHGDDFAS